MKTVIEMAREAGLAKYGDGLREGIYPFMESIERLVELARADERKSAQAEHEADKVIIEYHEATIKRLEAELKARSKT